MVSLSAEAVSKRECILVEAAKIFARFGFKKTSIDDIAKEAGVGKGTVYLAAESKEELFYQVVHREVRAWQARCASVIDPRVPADQLLVRLYVEAQTHLEASPLVRDLFGGEMVRMLPKWAARFDELRLLGRANLIEVLRIGIRQKRFRADLEVEHVAAILQDMHLAAWVLRPVSTTPVEMQARATAAFDLILRGVLDADSPA